MNNLNTSSVTEHQGEVVGRMGDYSLSPFLVVARYTRAQKPVVSLYVEIDRAHEWEAPNPRWTKSGGWSHHVLEAIHEIFDKNGGSQTQRKVVFSDEENNQFVITQGYDGDFVVATTTPDGDHGAVVSFPREHFFFEEALMLFEIIKLQNKEEEQCVAVSDSRDPHRIGIVPDDIDFFV